MIQSKKGKKYEYTGEADRVDSGFLIMRTLFQPCL